jgi:hypothetical protein
MEKSKSLNTFPTPTSRISSLENIALNLLQRVRRLEKKAPIITSEDVLSEEFSFDNSLSSIDFYYPKT